VGTVSMTLAFTALRGRLSAAEDRVRRRAPGVRLRPPLRVRGLARDVLDDDRATESYPTWWTWLRDFGATACTTCAHRSCMIRAPLPCALRVTVDVERSASGWRRVPVTSRPSPAGDHADPIRLRQTCRTRSSRSTPLAGATRSRHTSGPHVGARPRDQQRRASVRAGRAQ
jgi:hypothetical protein